MHKKSNALKQALMSILFVCFAGSVLWAQEPKTIGETDSMKTVVVPELYGKRLNTETTSSVSVLDSKSISGNTVMSFGNALYGRIPGLFVMQANGEPGDDYPTLFIRGKHTFTGSNSPLILVDGFPRDFNTLSVDEVENVSVLKDAAATAIFGMDAANGVILVTTKRGTEGKTRIGFKAEYGMMAPSRLPEFYGSYDYAKFYNMAEMNDGKTSLTYSQEQLDGYKNGSDKLLYPDVDWLGESLRDATPTQNYVVDFSGGSKAAKFYVCLGYTNSQGLFKEAGIKAYDSNNSMDRINFRSNIDVDITDYFRMSVDLAGRLENINSPYNSSSSIWTNLYTYHPNAAPIYAAPGIWGGTNTYRNNPLAYINDAGYRHNHRRLLQTSFRLDYDMSKVLEGLSVGTTAAFDNFYTVDNGYSKTFGVKEVISYNEADGTYNLSDMYGINGKLSSFGPSNEGEIRSNAFEFFANYDRIFGNHALNAKMVLHTDNFEKYFNSSDLSNSPDRRVSAGVAISYNFKKKYLLDVAASYGGGENFMRGKRFGWFPAVAGGWIISSEKFMDNLKAIDLLKLRASVGLVGNQNVGGTQFGYRSLYSNSGIGGWGAGTTNGGFGGGYAEAAAGNPDLTWEKALKTDVGVDLTLWKNLSFMVNYFNEYRTDILNSGNSLTPAYLGASFGYLNYGKVASNGFESSISFKHQNASWGYHANLIVSRQTNKILRMRETTKRYDYLYRQGQPIGQSYLLIADGFYSAEDVANRTVQQSFGRVIPGSIKYVDVNNDGIIDSDDAQPIGRSLDVPEWELGLNLGINFKGFYANANIQACLGRDVNLRYAAPYAASPLYYDRNISTWIKQPWTPEVAANPELASSIDFPSLTIENSTNNFPYSTFFLRNGDFLRLRSLEIGYELPKSWLKGVRIQNANLYLRGMNLLTLDHIKSFDPEVLEGYPVMKSYNVGVNLNF